jgi:uncharacterized peroxidase-related enzyme
VLRPGGRLGLTVWGHVMASPGAWALRPFLWAEAPKVAHQAAMNSLGKPGVGEEVLTRHGFEGVQRVTVPCVWEFSDPASFARVLASTGPAYEAIQTVGEEAFLADARRLASEHVRAGLPLRAQIDLVGFLARKPVASGTGASFLAEPAQPSEAARRLYEDDVAELGYVMNASRLWSIDADAYEKLFELLSHVTRNARLSVRDRGILVTATASTRGDAYCALSWGRRLAEKVSPEFSRAVIRGDDAPLDDRERALARWARAVAADPNAIGVGDLGALRDAGYGDAEIHAITTYIALRVALSTVNDALGAQPDEQLRATVPAAVLDAVNFGRRLQ